MLQVSSGAEVLSFGAGDLEMVRGTDVPLGFRRQRSCSLYESSGVTDSEKIFSRPRSRSFYMFEPEDSSEDTSSREDRTVLFQRDNMKKDRGGHNHTKLTPQKSTTLKKHPKKEHTGTRGGPKNIPMLTILEPDSWQVSSSPGMKYGQYVDWEKIDPESACRYREVVSSDHAGLKAMARSGFWTSPHTLRAKAYQHIIQRLETHLDRVDQDTYRDRDTYWDQNQDTYRDLAGRLFEEHGTSTHPFPKFMKDGEIPRYCLNKAGLNSVKKVLLCVSERFPEVTYCPLLPPLVSLLLHYSEDEARCFHSVCLLITYVDQHKRYIDRTFLTSHASCMTFGDLANTYCRGIRKLIASSHQSLFQFYSDWIMWIFADLPFTYAIRVLDVYLIEGYKVLYRVALALLSLYKVSVSSRLAHVDDFRQDMKRFVENVSRHSSPEALLQRAFNIQLPTRTELHYLYTANTHALIQKGIHNHSSYESVDLRGFSSSVVCETEMMVVWAWIPERFSLFSPVLLYSTAEHHRHLNSFYSRVEGHEPTVLLLKTVDEEVCGAFLSSDWSLRRSGGDHLQFFGTEECFVFTLRPGMERYQRTVLHISGMSDSSTCSSAHSVRTNEDPHHLSVPISSPEPYLPTAKFMCGDDHKLFIGGDGGYALCVDGDLTAGQSDVCETFESPALCRGRFKIQSLEVWSIQHTLTLPHTH